MLFSHHGSDEHVKIRGALSNEAANKCVDTMGSEDEGTPGLYACHGRVPTQVCVSKSFVNPIVLDAHPCGRTSNCGQ